ncbi:hypothetical protein SprV_0401655800 [Sparganum proliferum]
MESGCVCVSPSTPASPLMSIINTGRAPALPLPSSYSSISSASATEVPTPTSHNPDAPTNTNLQTVNSSDVGLIHTCPDRDRVFTSHIGLVGQLRIHRTETGEPVPGAPPYTHRTRLHCPHCPSTFTHRVGLFGHMHIHESGTDRSLDTASPSCTSTMPSSTPTPPSSTPNTISSTTLSTSCTSTMPSPKHTPSPSMSTINNSKTAIISETDADTVDFSWQHCPRTFTSHISLVGN